VFWDVGRCGAREPLDPVTISLEAIESGGQLIIETNPEDLQRGIVARGKRGATQTTSMTWRFRQLTAMHGWFRAPLKTQQVQRNLQVRIELQHAGRAEQQFAIQISAGIVAI